MSGCEVGTINHDQCPEEFPFTRAVIRVAEQVDHSRRLHDQGTITTLMHVQGMYAALNELTAYFFAEIMHLSERDDQE